MTNPHAAHEPGDGLGAAGMVRRHPAALAIARAWGELAPEGARGLVACSGGADSAALVLALAAFGPGRIIVGHVVHDLRPREEAVADRDAARELALGLGLEFKEASVVVASGNKEGAARRLRYAALERMARECGAQTVATAHHADDQLETLLMALLRGAGPAGLRGIAPRRRLSESVVLVRPMLGVTRAQAQELCRVGGYNWREDATNADTTRLRGALRARVLPVLEELRPGAAVRAAHAADLMRDCASLLAQRAGEVFGDGLEWDRSALAAEPAAVIGAGLRRAAGRLRGGEGADRLGERAVGPAVRAIRDGVRRPREFRWAGGVTVRVTSHRVSLSRG